MFVNLLKCSFHFLRFTYTISCFCCTKLTYPDGKYKHQKMDCHSKTCGKHLPKLNMVLKEFQYQCKSSSEHAINSCAIDLADTLDVVSCTQILCYPQNGTYFRIVPHSGNNTVNQSNKFHELCYKKQYTLNSTQETCTCAQRRKSLQDSAFLLNKYLRVLQFFSISFYVIR